MYQGIFDTDFDKYTEDAVTLFSASRACGQCSKISRVSRWTGRPIPAPSSSLSAIINARASSNTREYPFVSATEIKKALKLKAAFSEMLDQMQ